MEMQSFQRICLRKIYTILTLATIAFLFSTGTNAQETTLKVAMAHYPP